MIRILSLSTLIVTFLLGCSPGDEGNAGSELVFNVDSTQIAGEVFISELNVKFNPPKDWNEISSDLSEKVINELGKNKNSGNSFRYKPQKIFLEKDNHSLLSVGYVEKIDTSIHGNILLAYESAIKTSLKEKEYKEGKFTKDGIGITQFLIQKENLISFKLLFLNSSNELIQFDYASQQENYENNLRGIESSIGTIQLTN